MHGCAALSIVYILCLFIYLHICTSMRMDYVALQLHMYSSFPLHIFLQVMHFQRLRFLVKNL
jgi:hypothetical protein